MTDDSPASGSSINWAEVVCPKCNSGEYEQVSPTQRVCRGGYEVPIVSSGPDMNMPIGGYAYGTYEEVRYVFRACYNSYYALSAKSPQADEERRAANREYTIAREAREREEKARADTARAKFNALPAASTTDLVAYLASGHPKTPDEWSMSRGVRLEPVGWPTLVLALQRAKTPGYIIRVYRSFSGVIGINLGYRKIHTWILDARAENHGMYDRPHDGHQLIITRALTVRGQIVDGNGKEIGTSRNGMAQLSDLEALAYPGRPSGSYESWGGV